MVVILVISTKYGIMEVYLEVIEMYIVRKINGNKLAEIMDIPEDFKNKVLIAVIFDDKKDGSLHGILHKYEDNYLEVFLSGKIDGYGNN